MLEEYLRHGEHESADLFELWIDMEGNKHIEVHEGLTREPHCAWGFANFKTLCGATVIDKKYLDNVEFGADLMISMRNYKYEQCHMSYGVLARCITKDSSHEETFAKIAKELSVRLVEYKEATSARLAKATNILNLLNTQTAL